MSLTKRHIECWCLFAYWMRSMIAANVEWVRFITELLLWKKKLEIVCGVKTEISYLIWSK